MTLTEFQAFIASNAEQFAGVHPESEAALQQAETQLGRQLPPSLKWLLSEYGYSSACGIGSLQDAVRTTLSARRALGLPLEYVVLNDWNDAGVVCLDCADTNKDGEYPIYWLAQHNFARLATGEAIDGDLDRYEDYPAWVTDRLANALDEVNDD